MSKPTSPVFQVFAATTPDLTTRAPAPPWRSFARDRPTEIPYVTTPTIERAVNAALHLRRPLLVNGGPGTGKSSLAREIARQLGAERILKWPINSKSTLQDGLYRYDAVGRLRDLNFATTAGDKEKVADAKAIGRYLSLGPLGTALAPPPAGATPTIRVLLVDELDKSDLDLPNDLLDVLEDGDFVIPELQRIARDANEIDVGLDAGRKLEKPSDPPADGPAPTAVADTYKVVKGRVSVSPESYPFILITSNGEREFSPAFHRRCVHLTLDSPVGDRATRILEGQLGPLAELPNGAEDPVRKLVGELLGASGDGPAKHSIDQLLNLAWLLAKGADGKDDALLAELKKAVAGDLSGLPR